MGPNLIGVLRRRGEIQIQTGGHIEKSHVKTEAEDGHLHAKERGLRMKPALLTPSSWAFGLQNCEEISFCYLSHLVSDVCYSRSSKLTQLSQGYFHVSQLNATRGNGRSGAHSGGNSSCRGGEAVGRRGHTLPFCCHLSLEEKLRQPAIDEEAKLIFTYIVPLASLSLTYTVVNLLCCII